MGERTPGEFEWASLPDNELLKLRIRDLGLKLEGSGLEGKIDRLYRELDDKGIWCHPPCYLASEWATPEFVPAVGIAFYLAHPRLRRLEKAMMLEVEGAPPDEFMRILRHECGHAINYAFNLFKKKSWRETFGPFEAEYKDFYRVRPYSRRFVRNLGNSYAQMHPDEDFAETFAVWLAPKSNWRRDYEGWGALRKLEYMDDLLRREVIGRPPKVVARPRQFLWHVNRLSSTLGAHYRRRRAEHAHEFHDFYDPEIRLLFGPAEPAESDAAEPKPAAARFLSQKRRMIVDLVSRWSRETKFSVDQLIQTVIARSDELGLVVARSEEETLADVTAFLTSLAANYRYTGEFKRARR